MPALSQSLTFTVDSNSTVVLDYPNTGTNALIYISDPVKGDGYFGGSDGVHTVQIQVSEFVGIIEMQGTLAAEPGDTDWFTIDLGTSVASVDTTGALLQEHIKSVIYNVATSSVRTYNFTGNFVWVRAKVSEFTEGVVHSIKYNH